MSATDSCRMRNSKWKMKRPRNKKTKFAIRSQNKEQLKTFLDEEDLSAFSKPITTKPIADLFVSLIRCFNISQEDDNCLMIFFCSFYCSQVPLLCSPTLLVSKPGVPCENRPKYSLCSRLSITRFMRLPNEDVCSSWKHPTIMHDELLRMQSMWRLV
jgi:hypothetical protein